MTKIVQQVGGSKAAQDAYTGEPRQLTVDTDNWDLRLHDGVTPGGLPIINRDNGDERWQGKSPELDGFEFNPELRGFLVRQSSGNYRIRSIEFNGQQLEVENPDGYNGNPIISLKERIETSHIFGGDILIEGVLEVAGGVNADTSGTHFGNVQGNVTGNVTGNLSGNATGNHTGTFSGDVDVRGQTIQFDDAQIPLSAISGLLAFVKLNAVPAGVIMMWSGSVDTIPDGWELCNGLNGTPDLLDKFIIGAGSLDFAVGDEGGNFVHTHPNTMEPAGSHTHDITVAPHTLTVAQMPAHEHGGGVADAGAQMFCYGSKACPSMPNSIDNNGDDGNLQGLTETIGGGEAHGHAGSSSSTAGTHSHSLNNIAASSLPPYYALCYIMRVID